LPWLPEFPLLPLQGLPLPFEHGSPGVPLPLGFPLASLDRCGVPLTKLELELVRMIAPPSSRA
jgi:hypothetical protein